MQVPLSVVIITKNEEERLGAALESVQGWAEEIIVVDDDSTDQTRDIATRHADRLFVRRMEIEGRHRNWAYAQARNQWVLSLDADERLTRELRDEITQLLRRDPVEKAFTIPRKNFLGDYWLRYGGQYPAPQLKLFCKDSFRWEEVEVHPRAFLDGACGHLKEPLLHYTYRDWTDLVAKLNSQTTLEARKWFSLAAQDPKKARYKMNFLHALWRYHDRFLRTYIRKLGWRDGFRGFMVSYFAALYQLLAYAKFRQMELNKIVSIKEAS